MHSFAINDVKVCLNPVDLKADLYVSISIGVGFTPRHISHNDETIFIGAASAKMFLNYVSEYLKVNYSMATSPIVSMTSSSILLKTTKTRYIQETQKVLDVLFTIKIDEVKWRIEKENTINRFKTNYKDLKFRARMRMLEFSHYNKSFQLGQLTEDILTVDIPTITTMRESLIYPENCFIFIHGKADVDSLKSLKIEKAAEKEVSRLYKPVDITQLKDEKFEIESKGNYTCGSIKFDRDPTLEDMAKEYVVLMLIGQILFKNACLVEVDPLDVSLFYNERFTNNKPDLVSELTEVKIGQARKNLYESLYSELVLHPVQFVEKVGRLHYDNINYFEAMSILENIDRDTILEFLEGRNYKIREGHLRYYKEG